MPPSFILRTYPRWWLTSPWIWVMPLLYFTLTSLTHWERKRGRSHMLNPLYLRHGAFWNLYLLRSSAVFRTHDFFSLSKTGFLDHQMQFPFNGNHYSEWEQGADTHKLFTSLWGWGAQGHKPGSSNLDVQCCILGRFIPCLLDPTGQILSKIGHLVHCGTFFLHSKYVQRKVTLSTPYTAQLNIIIVIHVRSVGGILHGLNAFREMTEDV